MNMTTTVVDGNTLEISWPEDLTDLESPFLVNGEVIPSVRVREAALDGADEAEVGKLAAEAAVYRTEERKVIVVTLRDPVDGDEVLDDTNYFERPMGHLNQVFIVRRTERIRVRPWMVGTLARWELEPTEVMMTALFKLMEKHGRVPIAMVDRKCFFVRKELQQDVLEHFGIDGNVELNSHLLVRMGVLMKRPGGLPLQIQLPKARFTEDSNDGTILISQRVDEPRPGTLQIENDHPLYLKGMMRPPLELPDGKRELEGLVSQAQFGYEVPQDVVSGTFVAVRTLPHERCSLNYQALSFGVKDPEKLIRKDNARLKGMDIRDLFNREERRKIDAGVPPALLMRQYAPWKWATQFKVQGTRATVYGSYLVPIGSVRLLPDSFKAFATKEVVNDKERVVLPDWIYLHRDPAVPNATSMAAYQLDGEIYWSDSDSGEGIVVNPLDPAWKAAGGDFDGDAAVAMLPTFELLPAIETLPPLRKKQGVKVLKFRGTYRIAPTLVKMANGFTSRLGPSVMSSMRIVESPLPPILADEDSITYHKISQDAACVVQGAVDAKKHPIDVKRGRQMYQELREREIAARPEGGFFLDRLAKVRKAPGENAKVAAWRKLATQSAEQTGLTPIVKAMETRVGILNEIFEKTEWLRGDRAVLPDDIRNTAFAWLYERADAAEQGALVGRLSNAYRKATRTLVEAAAAGDKDAQELAKEVVAKTRLAIRLRLMSGEISAAAMIAYGPHRLAAELVSADDFEELGQTAQFLETVLFGTEWKDGTYALGNLDTIPSKRKAYKTLVEAQGAEAEVKVKVLVTGQRTMRVVLSW